MKAAVLYAKQDMRIEQKEMPVLGSRDVLIKVKACCICGTDPHIYEGRFPAPLPLTLGHEFSGEVVDVGNEVKYISIGERVTADINLNCGVCYFCRTGNKLHCTNIRQLGVHVDGAFAEYIRVPEENLYKIPDSVSWIEAAYVEPLACAISGQDMLPTQFGSTVVIIGAGPMGLVHTLLSKLKGAGKVIVTEINPLRAAKAEKLGADYVINPKECNAEEEIMKITKGIGADVVIEAVGSAITYSQAFTFVRKAGTILVFGAAPADATIEVKPFDLYSRELKIVSTYAGTYDTFIKAINLIENKKINPADIISHKISFADINEGINDAESNKDIIKTVVEF
jgi:2-desacetyl-2-hydroxyethyl bacteriochlorophyllide A dehydrogenase